MIYRLLRYLHHIDKDVSFTINAIHTPVTDWLWQLFSCKEIWFVLYLAIAVLLFRRLGWKRALVVIGACILCVAACDQFANFTKAYFQRLRPCHDAEMIARGLRVLENPGNLYGFYSAHAANALGFAICSWQGFRLDRKHRYNAYGWGILAWAFLVGISRVFVGKHFLGDVLTGFAVGLAAGALLSLAAKAICRKIQ